MSYKIILFLLCAWFFSQMAAAAGQSPDAAPVQLAQQAQSAPGLDQLQPPPQHRVCKTDQDCVIAESCCGTNAVNVKYANLYFKKKDCKKLTCTPVFPYCRKNTCVVVRK